jgi:hypothetical protein
MKGVAPTTTLLGMQVQIPRLMDREEQRRTPTRMDLRPMKS